MNNPRPKLVTKPATKQLTVEQVRSKYTMNLQGREYLQVAGRVLIFRDENPNGAIITEMLHSDETSATFKASVFIDGDLVATGHARRTTADANKRAGRYIELAETGAIGRALAGAGYGTEELADDDDDEDNLVDAPTPYVK